MNRQVALKVIKPHLVRNEAAVQRFRREVQAAARLHHKHIVTAYDAERAGDIHFLVMEFVPGVNLDEVIRQRGPLPVAEACDIVRQAAEGLQHAHELGMVHRDIKPHNLMVTDSGQVKILDFGLAGFATEVAEEEIRADQNQSEVETAAALHQLTLHGTMMGTPDYIAPEQAANAHSADIRADIYSLGCTLFTLLAGRAPFGEGSVLEKIKAHQTAAPPDITAVRPDVPAPLAAILGKMLAKDPAERYQTPAEVAAALANLRAARRETPSRARRWPLIAAAAGLLAVAAGIILYLATDTGRLEINSGANIPGAQIVLLKNGREYATFDVEPGPQRQTIRAGEYEIELRGAPAGTAVDVRSTKRGKPDDFGSPVDPQGKVFAVYRGGGMTIEVARRETAVSQTSEFFASLGDLPAIVRKTLTDKGLTVESADLTGPGVSNSRSVTALDAELSGEGDRSREVIAALRDKFKDLASQSGASFSNLDSEMQGIVAGAYLPYSAGQRVGQVRIELRKLFADKSQPKINKWNLHIQIEEWRKSPRIAASGNASDKPSQYFERLSGEPLESAVRERVGGDVGRRITAERIPQPPGRIRYEAQIDGVGSKIIDDVFVDLRDVAIRGTDARLVHEGERGIDLRLLRYTTPTHNGEVRVTLSSREFSGQPADESTKWLLKIEASEWVKGASQATPAVVRVEQSTNSMALTLDGARLAREELLARLDALASGDPGLKVHVEGDVVPITKEVRDLMNDIGGTSVGQGNVKFPSEVTRRLMDDSLQHGKAASP
jgi:hypothetical protein